MATAIDRTLHAHAHSTAGADRTDYCPREFVLGGYSGFHWQVYALLRDYLPAEDRETCLSALDDADRRIVERWMVGDESIEFELLSELADRIEENTEYYWEDGEVFKAIECELAGSY